jgi:hypothetical protein
MVMNLKVHKRCSNILFILNSYYEYNLDSKKFFQLSSSSLICLLKTSHAHSCTTDTHSNKSMPLNAASSKKLTCCDLKEQWNVHCPSGYELLLHDVQDAEHLGMVVLPFWYVHIPAIGTGIHSLKHKITEHKTWWKICVLLSVTNILQNFTQGYHKKTKKLH